MTVRLQESNNPFLLICASIFIAFRDDCFEITRNTKRAEIREFTFAVRPALISSKRNVLEEFIDNTLPNIAEVSISINTAFPRFLARLTLHQGHHIFFTCKMFIAYFEQFIHDMNIHNIEVLIFVLCSVLINEFHNCIVEVLLKGKALSERILFHILMIFVLVYSAIICLLFESKKQNNKKLHSLLVLLYNTYAYA